MTIKEIKAAIVADFDEIEREVRKALASGKFRDLRTTSTFPTSRMLEVHTSTHNFYLVDLDFYSRGHVFTMNPSISFRAIVETPQGRMMYGLHNFIYPDGVFMSLNTFTPHVFRRYRERMGYKQDGLDLMRTFFRRNGDLIINDDYRRKTMDDDTYVMCTCLDGAVFGYKHPEDRRCFVFSTFIANDTMEEGYKARFNSKYDQMVEDGIVEMGKLFPWIDLSGYRQRKNTKRKTKI